MKLIHKRSMVSPEKHHRGADRFDSELPVQMGDCIGLTRNVSATGIYFETEMAKKPGSRVHFVIEVHVQGKTLKLVCDGEIVRVDQHDGVVGVAAKLASSFFSDADVIIEVG